MESYQQANIIAIILSATISAIITVAGWFILNAQNRKIRRENAKRETYLALSSSTRNITKKIGTYKESIIQESRDIADLLKKSRSLTAKDKKRDLVEQWHSKAKKIIENTNALAVEVDDYTWTLDMGGTDFGEGSKPYEALMAVEYDAAMCLSNIIGVWIKYINFDSMSDIQIDNLTNDTETEINKLNELKGCLEDMMTLMYNEYIATPLKLNNRAIKQEEKRRYILKDGLSDNREYK